MVSVIVGSSFNTDAVSHRANSAETYIQDILASFLYNERKWSHIAHLSFQSMVRTVPSKTDLIYCP